MRTVPATIIATSILLLAACGDEGASPGSLPPTPPPTVVETGGPDTTDPPPTGPRPITIDDIEIDPDAAPAGPLFGSSAATESAIDPDQARPGDGEAICAPGADCPPDVIEPPDPFVPLPAHQPFCSLLAEMEQRPYPDDEFEQLVVAQAWFAELRVVTPDEIAAPFDVVIDLVDRIVASQDVDVEPAAGSEGFAAIETIGEFIERSC